MLLKTAALLTFHNLSITAFMQILLMGTSNVVTILKGTSAVITNHQSDHCLLVKTPSCRDS